MKTKAVKMLFPWAVQVPTPECKLVACCGAHVPTVLQRAGSQAWVCASALFRLSGEQGQARILLKAEKKELMHTSHEHFHAAELEPCSLHLRSESESASESGMTQVESLLQREAVEC